MQKYTDVVTSARSGAAIPNARVTVKTYPGDVAATIYSDDGITTQDNPITTDSNGAFSFYAADGRYSLTVSGTGITERTVTDILLQDPDDADAEQNAADVSFAQSGTAPTTRDIQDVERAVVRSGDFASSANFETRLEALTETLGVAQLRIQEENGIRFKTEGAAPFTVSNCNTTFNGTVDPILHFAAYNVVEGTANTKIVSGEPLLHFHMEGDYNNGSAHLMELNLDYVSSDGLTSKRTLAWNIDRSTHAGEWGMAGTAHRFYKSTIGSDPSFDIDLTNATDTVVALRFAGGSSELCQLGLETVGAVVTEFDLGFGAITGTGGWVATNGTAVKAYVGSTLSGNFTTSGLEVYGSATAASLLVASSAASPNGLDIAFTQSPDNNSNAFAVFRDGTTNRCIIWADGDLANHDNSYGAISDERLKQDIVDAGSQWDDIKNLRVRKYRFKSDVEAGKDHLQIGLVAQEVMPVSPGLVQKDKDGTLSVQYSIANVKMLKALQEAMARIEALEAQIASKTHS